MAEENKDEKPQSQSESDQSKPSQDSNKKNTTLLILITILVLIFVGAIAVGAASFDFRHFGNEGKNLENFEMRGMNRGFHGEMMGEKFNRGFGRQSGEVTKIDGSNITLKDSDGTEIAVKTTDTTSYYRQEKIAKQSDLKVGDKIVVLGLPDSNGIIQAKVISIQ